MANVSKIDTGGGNVYDVKDARARWESIATLPEKNYSTYSALENAIFNTISADANYINYEYRIIVHVPASSLTQHYYCGRVAQNEISFFFMYTDNSAQITYTMRTASSGSTFHQINTAYGTTVTQNYYERTNSSISATSTATWEIKRKPLQ